MSHAAKYVKFVTIGAKYWWNIPTRHNIQGGNLPVLYSWGVRTLNFVPFDPFIFVFYICISLLKYVGLVM